MSQTTYRNRHDRQEHHFGEDMASIVELAEAISTYPAGSTLQEVIELIHLRLVRLEGAEVVVGGIRADAIYAYLDFEADAIMRKVVPGTLQGDAVVLRVKSGSSSSDAVLQATMAGSWSSDTIIQSPRDGSYSADAEIVSA